MTQKQTRLLLQASAALLVVLLMAVAQLFPDHQTGQWAGQLLGDFVESSPTSSALPLPLPLPSSQADFSELELELATVAAIVDGDTIKLTDGRTLRYIGIDTPETKHPQKGVECYGQVAAERNAQLVAGQHIGLEGDVSATDRYGRALKYVWLNGQLVNEVLVAEGFAHARSYPPDIKYQARLQAAEAAARTAQRGLWGACPIAEP